MAIAGPFPAARELAPGIEQHRARRRAGPEAVARRSAAGTRRITGRRRRPRSAVVVAGPGRRLGVVLGEHDATGGGDLEAVEPPVRTGARGSPGRRATSCSSQSARRNWARSAESAIAARVRQAEAPHQRPASAAAGSGSLRRREEAGAEHGAERPVAEDQVPPPQLALEHRVRSASAQPRDRPSSSWYQCESGAGQVPTPAVGSRRSSPRPARPAPPGGAAALRQAGSPGRPCASPPTRSSAGVRE